VFSLVLSSVRHNAGRYLATLVAIITGVGFYTAVGFISDRVIESLEGNVDAQYGNVDVAVIPTDPTSVEGAASDPTELRISQGVADQLLALPGVEGGAGILTGSAASSPDRSPSWATTVRPSLPAPRAGSGSRIGSSIRSRSTPVRPRPGPARSPWTAG